MKTPGSAGLELLGDIARRAMLERGLLPEFSAAALKQTESIAAPAAGQRFDAIVTGAADKGTWVQISAPIAEG